MNIMKTTSRTSVFITYIVCINVYSFFRNTLKIILWYMFRDFYYNQGLIVCFNLSSYLMMLICGGGIGFVIHRHSILHASLAVAFGAVFAYLISGLNPNEYGLIIKGALMGAVLGCIGGIGGTVMRKKLCSKI